VIIQLPFNSLPIADCRLRNNVEVLLDHDEPPIKNRQSKINNAFIVYQKL